MSDKKLALRILTPMGSIIEKQELYSVTVPLVNGFPIGIHPGHAPLIAETSQGAIRYRSSDNEDGIEVNSGILKVRDNLVIILTSGLISELNKKNESYDDNLERLMSTLFDNSTMDHEVTN